MTSGMGARLCAMPSFKSGRTPPGTARKDPASFPLGFASFPLRVASFRCVSLHNHFVFFRFQSSQLHLLHLLIVRLLQEAIIVQLQLQIGQTLLATVFLIFDAIHAFDLIAQILVQLLLRRVGIVSFALESLKAMLVQRLKLSIKKCFNNLWVGQGVFSDFHILVQHVRQITPAQLDPFA